MSKESFKSLTQASKIIAIFFAVIIRLIIFPPRWGESSFNDVLTIVMAILSLLPNRWLVFSRVSFVLFLLIALFPLAAFIWASIFRHLGIGSVAIVMIALACLFGPLPLSLILSRMRFRRGENFWFA